MIQRISTRYYMPAIFIFIAATTLLSKRTSASLASTQYNKRCYHQPSHPHTRIVEKYKTNGMVRIRVSFQEGLKLTLIIMEKKKVF